MICCIKHWYQIIDLGLPFHSWVKEYPYLFPRIRVICNFVTSNLILLWGYLWTKSCLLGKIWQWNWVEFLGVKGHFFFSKQQSLIRVHFETSGHACVHNCKLECPSASFLVTKEEFSIWLLPFKWYTISNNESIMSPPSLPPKRQTWTVTSFMNFLTNPLWKHGYHGQIKYIW